MELWSFKLYPFLFDLQSLPDQVPFPSPLGPILIEEARISMISLHGTCVLRP